MQNDQVTRILISVIVAVGVFTVVEATPRVVNGSTIDWGKTNTAVKTTKVNTVFDDRGLGVWYDFAVSFCGTVLNKDPYQIIRDTVSGKKEITDDIESRFLTGYLLGMIITAGLGFLFILLMPIVGFCFCCCRLCNNCGGEMSQKERPNNACKRAVFGFILCIITLLMFTGVLLTFVCNDHISTSIKNSKNFVDGIVDEAVGFINTTFNEFDDVIDNDFDFVVQQLSADISDNGLKTNIGDPLLAVLDTVAKAPLDAVTQLSTNSKAMENQLEIITNNTDDLKNSGQTLQTGLQQAVNDINVIATNCSAIQPAAPPFCNSIDTSQLATDANYSTVPDVKNELDQIKEVTNLNFIDAAKEGFDTFRNIPMTMINKTSGPRSEIIKMISNATATVKDLLKDGRKTVDDGPIKILKDAQSTTHEQTDLVKTLDKYRWYACIGLTCLLLLIVVLLALGLMCGICGHDKEATPTTRGTVSHMGGNCLMAAVGFCFIFAAFLMLLTTICFLVGAPLQRIICEPLQTGTIYKDVIDNPATYSDGKLPLAKMLGGNSTADIKIGDFLDNCRKDEALYKAANIENLFNVSSMLNIKKLLGSSVDDQLDNLKVNLSDQTILTKDASDSLKKLNESGVEKIDFDAFLNETKKGITKKNLTEFAAELETLAANFSIAGETDASGNSVKLYELGNSTLQIAQNLRNLDTNTAQKMKDKANEMDKNVKDLKTIGTGLSAQAVNALNEADKAEQYLHTTASTDISKVVTDFSDRVLGWGYQFTDHVLSLLNKDLGKCKPLTNIYDGTLVYFCNDLLYPFNGFWLSIGFVLFFFIPSIIFSVKLAKHYRRMKYESDFDQEGNAGVEAYEMGQPPAYSANGVGQEKKLWANPKVAPRKR